MVVVLRVQELRVLREMVSEGLSAEEAYKRFFFYGR